MTTRPIVFQTNMIQAILDGKKTMTRRIVKYPIGGDVVGFQLAPDNTLYMEHLSGVRTYRPHASHYGVPFDRLWVKETFAKSPSGYIYRADWSDGHGDEVVDLPTGNTVPLVWKSSRFMPRIASRIQLEIVDVRIEPLLAITDDDAIEEGVDRTNTSISGYARSRFKVLWNSIYYNKPDFQWDTNPWIWAIKFRMVIP
jgi:hypothetical protein